MKAAKPASQIKRFVRLFAGHASPNTPVLFFRHCLSLPATLSVSKAMQLLKGNSSKWLRDTFPELRPQGFAWQEGFGAFSIGVSGVEDTIHYIQTQEEHHRKKSFREELEVFLKKHGYDYKAEMLD
jgi:putative transposase